MAANEPEAGLLGRDREVEGFARTLESLRSGAGRVVLVTGEAGIGKTRLVEEFAAMCKSEGVTVHWGRAWEGEGAPAYWPWIQALRPLIRSMETEQPAREAGAGFEFLRATFLNATGADSVSPAIESPAGRFALFDAVSGFLAALGRQRPFMLVLEDLHWADRSSLLLLEFVARDVAASPIILAATARESGAVDESFATVARHRHVELFRLGGLPFGDASLLVAKVAGAPIEGAELAEMMEMSGGNPFFLSELALSLSNSAAGLKTNAGSSRWLPATIQAAVKRRVDELPPETRRALEAAAVVGHEFSARLVARITRMDVPAVVVSLAQAQALRFVGPGHAPGGYQFVHAILRESLYQALAPDERMRLHLRTAEALESAALSDEAYVSEIARHYAQAGPLADPGLAAGWSTRAGHEALGRYAYLEAAACFEHALAILKGSGQSTAAEQFELQLARAEALDLGGERSASWDGFLSAAAVARRAGMAAELARTAIRAGTGRTVIAVRDDALITLMQSALAGLGEGDAALRVQLRAQLAKALYDAEMFDEANALSLEALEEAQRERDPVARCAALDARRYVIWQPVTAAERLRIGDEMLSQAGGAGLRELELLGSHTRVLALQDTGDIQALYDEIARHGRMADAIGLPNWQCYNTMYRSVCAQLKGDFPAAHQLSERFAAMGRRAEVPSTEIWLVGQTVVFIWLEGTEEAWLTASERAGREAALPVAAAVLAALASEGGDMERARGFLDAGFGRAVDRLPRDFTRTATMAALCCSAGVLTPEECAWLYDVALPNAAYNTMMGGSASLGAFARYLGRLALRMGRPAEAEQHYLAALELNERMGALPWLAWTQHDYAVALRKRGGAGDEARATELLRGALEIAARLCMPGLETKLKRLTALKPGARTALPGGLTKREAEVVVLLAGGLANQEIAARLVLSVKTIERHLANAYAKMDVGNRVDAATFAREHGLLTRSA